MSAFESLNQALADALARGWVVQRVHVSPAVHAELLAACSCVADAAAAPAVCGVPLLVSRRLPPGTFALELEGFALELEGALVSARWFQFVDPIDGHLTSAGLAAMLDALRGPQ